MFQPKKASYEIHMSNKNESSGFSKIHLFDLNMAQYLNQMSDSIDVWAPEKLYCFRPNVLFEYTDPKTKLKCRCWVDIVLGDPQFERARNGSITGLDRLSGDDWKILQCRLVSRRGHVGLISSTIGDRPISAIKQMSRRLTSHERSWFRARQP